MEFRDLKMQYKKNKNQIDNAIQDILLNAQFIGGSPINELEKKLAEFVGVKHCITCANGTDALQLALMAWGITDGDAVFVPDFTFFSTGEVVPWVGAVPIFVDVERDTFNMSITSLEKAILNVQAEGKLKPKAIIGVDLFGQPADYPRIKAIADKYGLFLLEDGAQGFGGQIGDKKACSFGDISTTSFFPAKPLGCYGDGGAVFTDNDEWNELIRSYKVHGKGQDKYDNIRIGMNSRLDTIQAAILLAKWDNFISHEIIAVNHVANKYTELLRDIVLTPNVKEGYLSSWAQYTIQLPDVDTRKYLQKELKEIGIPSMIYYAQPLHRQKAFSYIEYCEEEFVNSNILCNTVLSLPMHPYLTDQEVDEICIRCREILEKYNNGGTDYGFDSGLEKENIN